MCLYCKGAPNEIALINFIRGMNNRYVLSNPNCEEGVDWCSSQCSVHRALIDSLVKRGMLAYSKDFHAPGLSMYLLVEDT